MKTFTKINFVLALAAVAVTSLYSCKKNDDAAPKTPAVAQTTGNIAVSLTAKSKDSVLIMNVCPAGPRPDTIASSALLSPITTYLTNNYNGYTFRKAFKILNSGNIDSYVVIVNYNNKPVALKFNSSGTFTAVLEQREPADASGPGFHKGGRFENRDGKCQDTIAISAIPTLIKTYMTANYANDTLLHAVINKDTTYVIFSANKGMYATSFSSKGVFKTRLQINSRTAAKHVTVVAAALPSAIIPYLNKTYPGYVLQKIFAEKVKNGNVIDKYILLIDANGTRYAVQFDIVGNFVKATPLK